MAKTTRTGTAGNDAAAVGRGGGAGGAGGGRRRAAGKRKGRSRGRDGGGGESAERQALWRELGLDSSDDESGDEAGDVKGRRAANGKAGKGRDRKPLFDRGDAVYSAWWPETDVERTSSPSWYPGTVKGRKEVEIDGQLVGRYSVAFDDGDALSDLGEEHIKSKEDYAQWFKKTIKPVFEKGDEVYAAWWEEDKRTAATPKWYPGIIAKVGKPEGDGEYGPTRFYDVRFDDGDKLDAIEDCYIFNKEDYLLTMRATHDGGEPKWIGVKNVVDEESSDTWANLVGWYTADIDGEEQPFSFLSDALRAYDAHAIAKGLPKKSDLNFPEEYTSSQASKRAPRKVQQKTNETGSRTSRRIAAATQSKIEVGSRIYVLWPRNGILYRATVKAIGPGDNVKVHYDGRKAQSFDDVSANLIKGVIEDEEHARLKTKDEETPDVRPDVLKSSKSPRKTNKATASASSSDNATLLFKLACQSVASLGVGPSKPDLGLIVAESNKILKEALELYEQKYEANVERMVTDTKLLEEYKAALLSLNEGAPSAGGMNFLARGSNQDAVPDCAASSCASSWASAATVSSSHLAKEKKRSAAPTIPSLTSGPSGTVSSSLLPRKGRDRFSFAESNKTPKKKREQEGKSGLKRGHEYNTAGNTQIRVKVVVENTPASLLQAIVPSDMLSGGRQTKRSSVGNVEVEDPELLPMLADLEHSLASLEEGQQKQSEKADQIDLLAQQIHQCKDTLGDEPPHCEERGSTTNVMPTELAVQDAWLESVGLVASPQRNHTFHARVGPNENQQMSQNLFAGGLANECAALAEEFADSIESPRRIVFPPPDVRADIDRTALFVSKNGRAFESKILNSEDADSNKFAFLNTSSQYHAYYEGRIRFYGETGGEEEKKKMAEKVKEKVKEKAQLVHQPSGMAADGFLGKNDNGIPPNGLDYLVAASHVHTNYPTMMSQQMVGMQSQAWAISMAPNPANYSVHQHTHPLPAMPNNGLRASPGSAFNQPGMLQHWRESIETVRHFKETYSGATK